MAEYKVEFSRRTWSTRTENNYTVISADSINELLRKFEEEHHHEHGRIRSVTREEKQ